MNDRTTILHPWEPGEFDRVEARLRLALEEDARRARPADRLEAILREAHAAGPVAGPADPETAGARRWLAPVAAAAVVAAMAGGVWWSGQVPGFTPEPAATQSPSPMPQPTVTGTPTPTATATEQPTSSPTGTSTDAPTTSAPTSPAPTTSTTPSTTGSTQAPGATTTLALPAYFVGPIGDDEPTYKLFREFIRGTVPQSPSDEDKVRAALALAMNAQPYSNTDGYLQPWSGTRVTSADVTSERIVVGLSGPGADGFTAEVQRLAVQQLVWTAQAAVQRGNIPVRFTVASGESELFGSISTAQSFRRPPSDETWRDLAPIWITSPGRDEVLPASRSVTVAGEATVFEAALVWELQRGTTRVDDGTAMASIGGPGRGTYSIELGRLQAGTYTVRVWAASAEDGSVAAEDYVTFTVR